MQYIPGDDSPEQQASPRSQAANDAASKWIDQQSAASTAANDVFYSQLLHGTLDAQKQKEEKRKSDLKERREKVEKMKAEVDAKIEKMEEGKQKEIEAEKAAEMWMFNQQRQEEQKRIDEETQRKVEEQRAREKAEDAAARWIAQQMGE